MVCGARQAHIGLRQIRIGGNVKPGWTPLDAAKDQLLDRVKTRDTEPDGVLDGICDKPLIEHLHQSEHLDELALAAIAHASFEKTAQMGELSEYGRSMKNTCSFWRTPPMTPIASPKSTWAWPGACAKGTNVSRACDLASRT